MSEVLLRTPLHDWHAAHGARLVPFGGWEMPVQYTSIVEEHTATRTAAGLFDISHMGRLTFTGPRAAAFLDHMVTAEVQSLRVGQIRYALMTNEAGGVLDDVLVYCLPPDGRDLLLVVNASNRPKIVAWLSRQPGVADDVQMVDRTSELGMVAVQGPLAVEIVRPIVEMPDPLAGLPYYHCARCRCAGHAGLVSRTGYTGEDGVELMVPASAVVEVWDTVFRQGVATGLKPNGLGARDTLRLEAAMPLYGHELDEQTNPLEAGLGFAVKLDKGEFVGRAALQAIKRAGLSRKRVGLILEGRRIAREGMAILSEGRSAGRVSSGTFGPTVQKSIAMGYVPTPLAEPGTRVAVDVRGQAEPAVVVKLPFYKRRKE
jgi:aminomethyltransferase